MRLQRGLSTLRHPRHFGALKRAFFSANDRYGLRLIHFSVQSNHLHFLVEAEDARSLSRGMQGLNVRMARALNRSMQRRGRVFSDRYHAVILQSPTQTAQRSPLRASQSSAPRTRSSSTIVA
jgi:REP element-mobilizing transposase RayT